MIPAYCCCCPRATDRCGLKSERVLRALSPTVNLDEFSIPMQFRTSKQRLFHRSSRVLQKLVEEVYSEYGVEGYTSIDDTDIGDYSSSGFGTKNRPRRYNYNNGSGTDYLDFTRPHNSQSNLSRRRRSSRRRLSRRRILRRRLRRAFIRRVLGRLVLGRIFGRRRRLLRRRKLTRILIFHT